MLNTLGKHSELVQRSYRVKGWNLWKFSTAGAKVKPSDSTSVLRRETEHLKKKPTSTAATLWVSCVGRTPDLQRLQIKSTQAVKHTSDEHIESGDVPRLPTGIAVRISMTDILLLSEATLDNGRELTEGELEKVGLFCQNSPNLKLPNYKLLELHTGDLQSFQPKFRYCVCVVLPHVSARHRHR